ncbi:hypothetical protein [Pseudactinotalea sp. Z1732]|uniref:hypothetical protein n=1 Tax=Micrococcales TaxID=85006 RepID=UPI003C7CFE79
MSAEPLFRFEMKYVARRDDPYFHTRWDRARPITVVAATKQQAISKANAALGGDPGPHSHHVFRVVSVTDHLIEEAGR